MNSAELRKYPLTGLDNNRAADELRCAKMITATDANILLRKNVAQLTGLNEKIGGFVCASTPDRASFSDNAECYGPSPTPEQIEACINALERENERHCVRMRSQTETFRGTWVKESLSSLRSLFFWFVAAALCGIWLFQIIDGAFR
jgi:hypothetical protein